MMIDPNEAGDDRRPRADDPTTNSQRRATNPANPQLTLPYH